MSGENPRDGDQNDDHRDDQDDNNNRDRNHRRVWRYAYGSIGLDGIAMEWFRQRQARLAGLRQQEIDAYNRALDRLYLNAERVRNSVGLQL